MDAVIAYDPYGSGLGGIVLKYLLSTKLIVEINGDYHRLEPSNNFVKRLVMRGLLYLSVRWADAVKVLNKDQEAFFRRQWPTKPVYVFPNFASTDFFQSLESYQGDYLLSVGYPFHIKGVDILIQAFRLIARNHPMIKLRIMGYCPDAELVKYRELAGDDGRIEFVKPGWIEDVGEQMRGCYALVNAARSEAMGRVHLEAMACRKPIVGTRTNGGVECVEHGYTGLLCEIEDVEDLAKKLDYLLSRPEVARRMGEAGCQLLEQKFSEEKYGLSFLRMVEEVSSLKVRP